MPHKPPLGPRTIVAYNRLAREVAALHHVVRGGRPVGPAGLAGRRSLAAVIASANRLYSREPDMPRFAPLDPALPLTAADLALLVARLAAAGLAFEERYAHLSATPEPAPDAVWQD